MTAPAEHPCPAPGCTESVVSGQFACHHHWWALAQETRGEILATRRGPRARRAAARARAVRELRESAARRER